MPRCNRHGVTEVLTVTPTALLSHQVWVRIFWSRQLRHSRPLQANGVTAAAALPTWLPGTHTQTLRSAICLSKGQIGGRVWGRVQRGVLYQMLQVLTASSLTAVGHDGIICCSESETFIVLLQLRQDNRGTFCPAWDQSLHRWRPPGQACAWAAGGPAGQPCPVPSSSPRTLHGRRDALYIWKRSADTVKSPKAIASCPRRRLVQPIRVQREEDECFDWRM